MNASRAGKAQNYPGTGGRLAVISTDNTRPLRRVWSRIMSFVICIIPRISCNPWTMPFQLFRTSSPFQSCKFPQRLAGKESTTFPSQARFNLGQSPVQFHVRLFTKIWVSLQFGCFTEQPWILTGRCVHFVSCWHKMSQCISGNGLMGKKLIAGYHISNSTVHRHGLSTAVARYLSIILVTVSL